MKNKKLDAVKMMRNIRDKLSNTYKNPQIEEKELQQIRKKYKMKSWYSLFNYPFSGERIMVTVGDGGSIPVYLHELMVKVGTHEFKAVIGFSDRLGVSLNIIGRKSFFEEFVVCFDDKEKLLALKFANR